MISFFLRTWAILLVVLKRMFAQWNLALVTVAGLVTSISLVVSIPLFTDAVYRRIFMETIQVTELQAVPQPPFSFLFGYSGGVNGGKQWDEIQPIDQYLASSAAAAVGLPQKSFVRFVATDASQLFPANLTQYEDKANLGWVTVGAMQGLEEHIRIIDGQMPTSAGPDPDSVVDVIVSTAMANKLGLQVGEQLVVMIPGQTATGSTIRTPLPVRIAALWMPQQVIDPHYWMFSPSSLAEMMLVSETTFTNRISPSMPGEVYSAFWYLVLDGSQVQSAEVETLVQRIRRLQVDIHQILPGVKLNRSPMNALLDFQQSARQLNVLLYAFSIPIIGLILAFISLVSNQSIERKRSELAIMRSRGATALQMLGTIALESLILGVVALLLSLPVAMLIARVIGQIPRFTDFGSPLNLHVRLTLPGLQAGLVAVLISLTANLLPAVDAVQYTIVSYKRERARQQRAPWWQRVWLDVLLLFPVGYGAYLLNRQGSLLSFGQEDPLGNPLLFLIPALTILSLSLFSLRLIPPMMRVVAWLAGHTRSVGMLMAARLLARTPSTYATPLLILIFTLSLSAYTASLAQTINQHIFTSTYYQLGADMRFTDTGSSNDSTVFALPTQADSSASFLFYPVSEYLKMPGVEKVTRVGAYPARVTTSQGSLDARFIGIDRVDFSQVAFWRRNFASQPLGVLMNALGMNTNGVLASREWMAKAGVNPGDTLQISVRTDIGQAELPVRVVESFALFPTWYSANDGPLFVGNLDYLFQQAGGQVPYQVWLKTNPTMEPGQDGPIELRELDVLITRWDAARPLIRQRLQRPEQQGVFSFLFIGFIAAVVLTVIGFFLYTLYSYKRRFIEFGVLRASGLSRLQMSTYLAFELFFLIAFGGAAGTGLGALISHWFIPYLQLGTEITARVPPFEILIDWNAILQMYILFGMLFTLSFAVLIAMLQRLKIFLAIKMGETQ